MMYPYCKYSDETEVVFSHIMKNENGEEIMHVHFERATDEEIEIFKTVVERGLPSFYRLAREGGLRSA